MGNRKLLFVLHTFRHVLPLCDRRIRLRIRHNLARDLRPLYITRSTKQILQYIKTLPLHEMQQRNTFKNIFILFHSDIFVFGRSLRSVLEKFLLLQIVKSARLTEFHVRVDRCRLEKIQSILECRNRLSEVHDFFSDGMHCNGTRHCSGSTILTAAGLVASLPRVVLLLNQVVSCAEGHEMRVVCRCGDGHRPSASYVRVAQLVS